MTLSAKPATYSWVDEFHAYTAFHFVTLGVCAAMIVAACVIGCKLKRRDLQDEGSREARFSATIGWSIVAWHVMVTLWRLLPENFSIDQSLPLHMCRWTVWTAAWVMIARGRRARSLTYFWGIGMCSQGLFTPLWEDGLASPAFWMYWVGHLQIVGVAVYDLVVRRWAPTRKDYLFAAIMGLAFAAIVIPANLLMGTNYSYLGKDSYANSSVVDMLGDWPWRPIIIVAAAQVAVLLLMLAVRLRQLIWYGRWLLPSET